MDQSKADQQRQSPQQIISECEKITRQFVKTLLVDYFKEVEARLLEFADKAKNNAQQWQLLEVSRSLKQQKIEIEVSFLEELRNGFSQFQSGKLGSNRIAKEDISPNLSLVANDKLEVELAQSSFARRAETRFNEDLFALNQRFSMMLGGRKIAEDNNPVGPAQLAHCLQQGIGSLTKETKIIILLYKVFEKVTLPQLLKLYGDINKCLIGAGVLPNLRYAAARQAPSEGGAAVARTTSASADPSPRPHASPPRSCRCWSGWPGG